MATVLVVEDNAANMTLATFLLQSAGHTVLSAVDAEAGLTIARDAQPDLILMDIQLPGMDGLEATILLKRDEATRAIPIIALTALAMKGDEERARAAGCDGYIAKPMRYKEFLSLVAHTLNPKVNSMSTPTEKINEKLDAIAESAKDGAGRVVGTIVDTANSVAHAVVEKARKTTEKAGDTVVEAGEKLTKLGK